jgi:hypothetical protein
VRRKVTRNLATGAASNYDVRRRLFEPKDIGKPPAPAPAGAFRIAVAESRPSKRWTRTDKWQYSVATMPQLHLDIGERCLVNIAGVNRDAYDFELYGEVTCEEEQLARLYLQQIELHREGNKLSFQGPPYVEPMKSRSHLHILSPADRPIFITGSGIVELHDIKAAVVISLKQGAAILLTMSGPTVANANSIVFSGGSGNAYLVSQTGIDLKLTDQKYAGVLEATAVGGDIHAFVPVEFSSTLEVNVRRKRSLKSEIGASPKWSKDSDGDSSLAMIGSGSPSVKIKSWNG